MPKTLWWYKIRRQIEKLVSKLFLITAFTFLLLPPIFTTRAYYSPLPSSTFLPLTNVYFHRPITKINFNSQVFYTRANWLAEVKELKKFFGSNFIILNERLTGQEITLAVKELKVKNLKIVFAQPFTYKIMAKKTPITYETIYQNDPNLEKGKNKIKQKGEFGQKEEKFLLIYQNKKLAEKILLSEKIIRKPKNEIVLKGTKDPLIGWATWYGLKFHGARTSSGEKFDMYKLTAAHRTLPFGTLVKVINLQNGKSVVVRINDRGPYSYHIIDLSYAAKEAIGMESMAWVKLVIL